MELTTTVEHVGMDVGDTHTFKSGDNDTICCICSESLSGGFRSTIQAECKHTFHARCLRAFCQAVETPTCPSCHVAWVETQVAFVSAKVPSSTQLVSGTAAAAARGTRQSESAHAPTADMSLSTTGFIYGEIGVRRGRFMSAQSAWRASDGEDAAQLAAEAMTTLGEPISDAADRLSAAAIESLFDERALGLAVIGLPKTPSDAEPAESGSGAVQTQNPTPFDDLGFSKTRRPYLQRPTVDGVRVHKQHL